MSHCDWVGWQSARRARLHGALEAALPPAETYPARLHGAMRYACEGGKRLRGLLVYAVGEALQADAEALDAPAVAVELIHAFSLVHDDLPAMDDDDLRRGRPTVHKAFDEGTAVLVGDALQTLAFEQLASANAVLPAAALEMLRELASASGSRGMTGGQQADLEAEGQTLALSELEQLHAHKTGALILASVRLAAAAAGASAAHRAQLDIYGRALGLAYQIQDDILDVTASSETLGKTAGKDLRAAKSTYVQLMGLAAAQAKADTLLANALQQLEGLGSAAAPLRELTAQIGRRQH